MDTRSQGFWAFCHGFGDKLNKFTSKNYHMNSTFSYL